MPKPYVPNDAWSKRAAAEGYRARSVYKLMELDQRFKLLRPVMNILDIGAAPGSWLQYESKQVGNHGKIIGVDLQPIAPVADNVVTYQADITDRERMDAILKKENMFEVDLVLSDIAPNTSGVKDVDQWRSIELTQAVIDLAFQYLKPGGRAVCKVFRGADFDEFLGTLKRSWKEVKMARVEASRDRSREVYLLTTK